MLVLLDSKTSALFLPLTPVQGVVNVDNMKADRLLNQRVVIHENAFVEMVVWHVPEPVRASQHDYKYRLAYVVDGQCVLRFDNEAGKGDHYHRHSEEFAYRFDTLDRLLEDFWRFVDEYTDD